MNVHVLQHVDFEGLGGLLPFLEARGARISYSRLWQNDVVPEIDGIDLLIALGGPMSANDDVSMPGLRREKELLRAAVDRDVPTLAICLGAQLLASALGARVTRNPVKEIGWFPVRATRQGDDVLSLPAEADVFQWHSDAFDIPEGAVPLASSDACANQAFQVKRNVVGVQFHPEMTRGIVQAIVADSPGDLKPQRFVQGADELLRVPEKRYQQMHRLGHDILDYVTRSALIRTR